MPRCCRPQLAVPSPDPNNRVQTRTTESTKKQTNTIRVESWFICTTNCKKARPPNKDTDHRHTPQQDKQQKQPNTTKHTHQPQATPPPLRKHAKSNLRAPLHNHPATVKSQAKPQHRHLHQPARFVYSSPGIFHDQGIALAKCGV